MGQILYPPKIIDMSEGVIFLAGPIQGADNWHKDAIKIIQNLDNIPNIACPRRPELIKTQLEEFDYEAQVDWETYYLRKAGQLCFILNKF